MTTVTSPVEAGWRDVLARFNVPLVGKPALLCEILSVEYTDYVDIEPPVRRGVIASASFLRFSKEATRKQPLAALDMESQAYDARSLSPHFI